jgi:dolichyl-phosphate beta-glucosyltransferase|tara:strand:- start:2137 stop:2862 length:726 start_codon:yes stop_codon:yes gene_type:complete
LNKTLSIVFPAYNEEKTILQTIYRTIKVLNETGFSYEIIIVNDGSRDRTRDVILNHNDGNIKLISYNVNVGKGHAIRQGFLNAKGKYVVFLDSDLDINVAQINIYLRALSKGDLIIASKLHPQSEVRVPFLRWFLSRLFNVFVRLFTGLNLRDTQTGLKAVRREALAPVFQVLSVRRFAFDVELLAVAQLYGVKIIELPVTLRLRNVNFSIREIFKMFIDLLGVAYRLRILQSYKKQLFSL